MGPRSIFPFYVTAQSFMELRLRDYACVHYFYRYAEDALDLCDVLSAFPSQGKVTLHELCRVMGLPGKPQGISGAEVDKYYRDGHIAQIAAYCEGDVVNTYRVWLRYELFRGKLSVSELQASETCLVDFINARESLKLDRVHFHTDAAPDSTLLCPKR
jgi:predicted PolB exonuclease-like 3'-5' exonuclease